MITAQMRVTQRKARLGYAAGKIDIASAMLAFEEAVPRPAPSWPSGKKQGGVGSINEYKNAEIKRGEILALMADSPPMTVPGIAELTGENKHATRSRIIILRDRKLVHATGKQGAFTLWGLSK